MLWCLESLRGEAMALQMMGKGDREWLTWSEQEKETDGREVIHTYYTHNTTTNHFILCRCELEHKVPQEANENSVVKVNKITTCSDLYVWTIQKLIKGCGHRWQQLRVNRAGCVRVVSGTGICRACVGYGSESWPVVEKHRPIHLQLSSYMYVTQAVFQEGGYYYNGHVSFT